jgi:hypothetical protein
MTTQPRMSAPIGRLRIRTSEGRKRRASGSGAWQPVESPVEAEAREAEEASGEGDQPRFYPFPLRATDERGD